MARPTCQGAAKGRAAAPLSSSSGVRQVPGSAIHVCPFCRHAVEYVREDGGTARLAIVSHLVRVHAMTMTRLLLEFPELERATLSYFRFLPVRSPFSRGNREI